MKMRIALFTEPGADIGEGDIWTADFGLRIRGKIQRSEAIEVDFPEIPRKETVLQELAILDEMTKEVRADTERKLSAIEDQRAKLLAITDQRNVA